MKTYCTIITFDYIHYALTLNESLLSFNPEIQLKVFISDSKKDLSFITKRYPNIEFYFIDDLCSGGIGEKIFLKYEKADKDHFRWSMKSVFISFLLNNGYEKVYFLDCDLFFFAPFDFIDDSLEGNDVILTPHWRSSIPQKDEANFAILQTSGLFNAGFVGVSKSGIDAMMWWANVCIYRCEKSQEKGFFVDQGYLDLMPVYFDNVKILKHRGCNIANWNQIECKRFLSSDKTIKINGIWDIIFIHFTRSTINGIKKGSDVLLKPYLEKYLKTLEKYRNEVHSLLSESFKNMTFELPSVEASDTTRFVEHNFLSPKLSFSYIDKYIVRDSILTELKAIKSRFKGILLDIGCGQMPYKPFFTATQNNVTRYIGLDLEDNPIHINKPDITWENDKIPLDDKSVDCAIATEVFEHCPDPIKVIREINRVLKSGGILFFTVPFIWPLHEVPHDEYRYTPYSLNRILIKSGFSEIELKPLGGWDASMGQMLGLWARRRPMNRWKRLLFSILLMPIVSLLYRSDKKQNTKFMESQMITGLSGTAIKNDVDI